MELIVNADDLGINKEVNRATFDLMEWGRITSATLLANAPDVEDACARLHEFPQCSFGAHLNASEFTPLSGPGRLQPLLDSMGFMDLERFRQTKIDKALAEGIFQEFCAQIDKLISLGVPLSHVDSHHYILSVPQLFTVLKRVQKKYRIRKVRISRNIYADRLSGGLDVTPFALGIDPDIGYKDVGKALRIKKWAYNLALRRYFRTKTTDGFSGFRLLYESAKAYKMRQHTFEVNVHPENSYYDSSEIEILEGPWEEEVGFPIRLISYNDLT